VPLVAVILFLALYPQLALHRSERSVRVAVARAQVAVNRPRLSAALESQTGLAAPPGARKVQEISGTVKQ